MGGKDLKWAPMAQQTPNVWIMGVIVIAVITFATVGAIVFFFMARAQQMKSGA